MRRDSREHYESTRWPWWMWVIFWGLSAACIAAGFVLGVEILVRL